ncbi:MAG: hypothetical protein VYC65_01765, partial [Chloroflexota bacterium]|nr:hypothetical protein [Chloroflexota bacterium]
DDTVGGVGAVGFEDRPRGWLDQKRTRKKELTPSTRWNHSSPESTRSLLWIVCRGIVLGTPFASN